MQTAENSGEDDIREELNNPDFLPPNRETLELSAQKLAKILEPDGNLETHLNTYEPRSGQIAMLKSVVRAFNESRSLVVEAGTGIGKSLAYLLPALQWVAVNEGRIVVSTATIALQQQLMEKDIPLAQKLIRQDVTTALVKGRGNYLCLKRLNEAWPGDDLFGMGNEMATLRQWGGTSVNGELSDLPFRPGVGLWEQVRCEADSCPGSFCSYYEQCFFIRARRQAFEASLIVSNHHLLFADLATRREGVGQDESAVLPPYHSIIFDEAHHVEAGATALFSDILSLSSLNRLFYRLYRRRGKTMVGLLQRIAEKRLSLSDLFIGAIPRLIDKARATAEILDALGQTLFTGSSSLRLAGEPGNTEKSKLLEPMDNLHRVLVQLTESFTDGIREFNDDEPDRELQGLAIEAQQAVAGLQETIHIVDSFIHRTEYTDQVFWLDVYSSPDGGKHLRCHRTPLSVASMVRESVWEPYATVISVSATLAHAGNFQHWRSRLGADSIFPGLLEEVYPSPFDFASQVMLGIPADAPHPESRTDWENYLVETTASLVNMTGGYALVLFTSFETLRMTITGVRSLLGEGGPMLLAQGDDDRGRLLKRFREHPSSVLFATDSFWEGVDVPGEALRLVIITRLPFKPPNDPVNEARREAVAAAGAHPFLTFTVPTALTRFRQGFGRLMRHRDDYGAVLILDPRIIRKPYGKLFLDALPPTFQSIKSTEGVLRDFENFWCSMVV